jgi:DDE superfamily endonuclease
MPPTKNPRHRKAEQTARESSVQRPHPSRGGTRGYDIATRELALAVKASGEEDNPVFQQLRQHPSIRSTSRWQNRMNNEGHFHPYEMNGNAPAQVLQGNQLFMLSLFRIIYPKATAAEVNAFLFTCTLPGQPYRFYSESQINRAEDFFGLSRKKASTTAYQASLPINQAKRQAFWTLPYPYGINGTSRATIIDWDEAAVFIESTNRGFGKCFIGDRAREEGPYNHSTKYTLIAAICGGPNGGVWIDLSDRTGTSIVNTYDFLEGVITDIGNGGGGNTHTFICDNLTAHHSPLVRLLIHNREYRLVFRAPYHPVDGPIEYFFNHLQQQLTLELYNFHNEQQLQQAIVQICQRANSQFDRYFEHCGYAP